MTSLVMALVAGGVGLVLWRASLAAFVDHTMTPGALLQFVLLSVLAAGSTGSLGEAWGDVQKTAGAMARIAEILDARPWPSPRRHTRGSLRRSTRWGRWRSRG